MGLFINLIAKSPIWYILTFEVFVLYYPGLHQNQVNDEENEWR